ncbi:MAG TPA: UpxY family transcription antiterminator [Flavisolibacter sp.]|nr:UpxY family transcription antiterminator [Flavisolibacter sp.]
MSTTKKWYAVYTKPRWEKKVHRLLEEKQFESYCPLNKVHRKWSDRVKVVHEPLFKSYVFVRIREADKTAVRMLSGVVNFVYWLGKPAIVKDKEIEIIRKFLNEYENVEVVPLELSPGMKIRVNRGVLMDREGTVRTVLGNKVQVMIESIGYSLIASVNKSNIIIIEKK